MTIVLSAVRENATDRNRRPRSGREIRPHGPNRDHRWRSGRLRGGPGRRPARRRGHRGRRRTGAGGACVLSDCVPSKTFIASSDVVTAFRHGDSLGVRSPAPDAVTLDAAARARAGQAARPGPVRATSPPSWSRPASSWSRGRAPPRRETRRATLHPVRDRARTTATPYAVDGRPTCSSRPGPRRGSCATAEPDGGGS